MEQSSGTTGPSAECEGEEQDDSSNITEETSELLANLDIKQHENKNEQDVLSEFREQWKRELKSTPSPQRVIPSNNIVSQPTHDQTQEESIDEKARQLFLRGVELERCGQLYEAVQHYRRAVMLQPDVEKQLYAAELRATHEAVHVTPPPEEPSEYAARADASDDDDEDEEEGEGESGQPRDLSAKFSRILARKGHWCEPLHPQQGVHISALPAEVVGCVVRWAAGAELDARALCRLAGVCRGWLVAARDPHVWRDMCLRTWGRDCASPRALGFLCWRDMFALRPRLRLDGCYISKTSYVRAGENAYQDHSYRPWYLVDYYRYFRFFPAGVVLVWTTAEPPAAGVTQLRSPRPPPGAALGHYRLMGDKVVIVAKKSGERRGAAAAHSRFRSRRRDSLAEHDLTYHIELQLSNRGGRRNWQLRWRAYSVAGAGGAGAAGGRRAPLDLPPARFPPLAFSPVAHYTALSTAPLRA